MRHIPSTPVKIYSSSPPDVVIDHIVERGIERATPIIREQIIYPITTMAMTGAGTYYIKRGWNIVTTAPTTTAEKGDVVAIIDNTGPESIRLYNSGNPYISLKTLVLGSNIKSIAPPTSNYGAFDDCTALESVVIPHGVTTIPKWAFYDCENLASITIPDSVESIGDAVFESCTSLTSITIPNSVESIGNYAFYYCSSLTDVTFLGDISPVVDTNAFYNISSSPIPTLYVTSAFSNQVWLTTSNQSNVSWKGATWNIIVR
jgi:hypothetical protein